MSHASLVRAILEADPTATSTAVVKRLAEQGIKVSRPNVRHHHESIGTPTLYLTAFGPGM